MGLPLFFCAASDYISLAVTVTLDRFISASRLLSMVSYPAQEEWSSNCDGFFSIDCRFVSFEGSIVHSCNRLVVVVGGSPNTYQQTLLFAPSPWEISSPIAVALSVPPAADLPGSDSPQWGGDPDVAPGNGWSPTVPCRAPNTCHRACCILKRDNSKEDKEEGKWTGLRPSHLGTLTHYLCF